MTTIPQFRESLVQALLSGTPFENIKLRLGKQSMGHLKDKLPDHQLEETGGAVTENGKFSSWLFQRNTLLNIIESISRERNTWKTHHRSLMNKKRGKTIYLSFSLLKYSRNHRWLTLC